MNVLMQELKKIWSPPILAVLLVLGLIYYYLFMASIVNLFPNGHPETERFEIASEWVEKYGVILEPEDRQDAEQELLLLYEEADRWIAADPVFADSGIESFNDIQTIRYSEDISDEDSRRLGLFYNSVEAAEAGFIGYRIQALENMFETYDSFENPETAAAKQVNLTTGQAEHLRALIDSKVHRNILPNTVIEYTSRYASFLIVFLVLSLSILLSPLLVRDRMEGINRLAYSSKTGRRIFAWQFFGTMLSALILVTAELLVFGRMFLQNDVLVFSRCRLFSFDGYSIPWVNMTYGQYLLLLVGIVYLFTLAGTCCIFFLARYSSTYISMLLKVLPLFLFLSAIGSGIATQTLFFNNTIYLLTSKVGSEFWLLGLLLVTGAGLMLKANRKQKAVEL